MVSLTNRGNKGRRFGDFDHADFEKMMLVIASMFSELKARMSASDEQLGIRVRRW